MTYHDTARRRPCSGAAGFALPTQAGAPDTSRNGMGAYGWGAGLERKTRSSMVASRAMVRNAAWGADPCSISETAYPFTSRSRRA